MVCEVAAEDGEERGVCNGWGEQEYQFLQGGNGWLDY